MADEVKLRCGFVAVLGPTNSGKSTLVNSLVGQKVTIVSSKVQTTYHGVRGILNDSDSQVIFTDTPGFQGHGDRVAKMLNQVAENNATQCEMAVWVFDATSPRRALAEIEGLRPRIERLFPAEKSLLVLNKVDRASKPELLPLLEKTHAMGIFAELIPLSALRKDGLDRLLAAVKARLPEGPALYPRDCVTDRPEDFRFSEIIREQIYLVTRQELPYSARVEMENFEGDRLGRVPTVRALIHVDSDSRKGILIGTKGEKLKVIGTAARAEMERITGRQICLKIHVDVEAGWRKRDDKIQRYLEMQ